METWAKFYSHSVATQLEYTIENITRIKTAARDAMPKGIKVVNFKFLLDADTTERIQKF